MGSKDAPGIPWGVAFVAGGMMGAVGEWAFGLCGLVEAACTAFMAFWLVGIFMKRKADLPALPRDKP